MSEPTPFQILIFAPSSDGGIAEHTYYQARALQKLGVAVLCLTQPAFLSGRALPFPSVQALVDGPPSGVPKFRRRIWHVLNMVANYARLVWQVMRYRPQLVLLDCYAEYFAPLWVWPHWMLARILHIKYAANLHDPVRNFQLGPAWWHRLSVWTAYLPLDFVLVHNQLPEPSPVPASVRVVQVPVGVYDLPSAKLDRQHMRQRWGVRSEQKVFLSFGYVRDGKNLDLAIRALASVPDAFLVVAGAVASSKDKSFAFYRELTQREGVSDRVRFFEGFVSDEDLANYFAAADFALLTYSSAFHSQSGVLNIAVRARVPVLASAAPSPLIESVERYELGVAIKPDSIDAIVSGLRQLLGSNFQPQWSIYEAFADWDANARGLLETAGLKVTASLNTAGPLATDVQTNAFK